MTPLSSREVLWMEWAGCLSLSQDPPGDTDILFSKPQSIDSEIIVWDGAGDVLDFPRFGLHTTVLVIGVYLIPTNSAGQSGRCLYAKHPIKIYDLEFGQPMERNHFSVGKEEKVNRTSFICQENFVPLLGSRKQNHTTHVELDNGRAVLVLDYDAIKYYNPYYGECGQIILSKAQLILNDPHALSRTIDAYQHKIVLDAVINNVHTHDVEHKTFLGRAQQIVDSQGGRTYEWKAKTKTIRKSTSIVYDGIEPRKQDHHEEEIKIRTQSQDTLSWGLPDYDGFCNKRRVLPLVLATEKHDLVLTFHNVAQPDSQPRQAVVRGAQLSKLLVELEEEEKVETETLKKKRRSLKLTRGSWFKAKDKTKLRRQTVASISVPSFMRDLVSYVVQLEPNMSVHLTLQQHGTRKFYIQNVQLHVDEWRETLKMEKEQKANTY